MNRSKAGMLRKRLRLAALYKRLLLLIRPQGDEEGNGFRETQRI